MPWRVGGRVVVGGLGGCVRVWWGWLATIASRQCVPQRKLTIFRNYKVIATKHRLSQGERATRKRHETQFRLDCWPRGFMSGCVLYLCYDDWFGCLFANTRCYANVVPMSFVQEALSGTGHQKTSTAGNFKLMVKSETCCRICELQSSCFSTACVLSEASVCSYLRYNAPMGLSNLQNKQKTTLPCQANQSHQMLLHMYTNTLTSATSLRNRTVSQAIS